MNRLELPPAKPSEESATLVVRKPLGDVTEIYLFRYHATREGVIGLLRHLGRTAADPRLAFCWYDAAKASQHVRNLHSHGELE